MGHSLTAIIASAPVVEPLVQKHSFLVSIPLREPLFLVPVEDDDMARLVSPSSDWAEGFVYLSSAWRDFLARHVTPGPLIYLETDYFGGMGTQAAAVFAAAQPPQFFTGTGAINRALRTLGVVSQSPGQDEFDFLGLARHCDTGEWKEAANA
ncbi:MAG: hypothetical protein ACO1TE_28135 [Prosthecobacter sp.]